MRSSAWPTWVWLALAVVAIGGVAAAYAVRSTRSPRAVSPARFASSSPASAQSGAPTTTTPATPAPTSAAELGTAENPVPLGQQNSVGKGWLLRVNSIQTAEIALPVGAPPAPTGKRYIVANVTSEYDGSETEAALGIDIEMSGNATGIPISRIEDPGVVPAPAWTGLERGKGVAETGNLLFLVDAADIESLELVSRAFGSFGGDGRVHFATR